jgi:hypothetical protein
VANHREPIDYDVVELRSGRLNKIRRSEARMMGETDGMAPVVKCYCRSHDVLTQADAERQTKPTFVFPMQYFGELESLIGRELEGRIYQDSVKRRVKFLLDLKEHAGFQMEEGNRQLESPWFDESALKE